MRNHSHVNKQLCKQIHEFAVTKTEFQKVEKSYSNLSTFIADFLKTTVLEKYFPGTEEHLIKILVMGSYALKNGTKKFKENDRKRYNDLDLKIIFPHHFYAAEPELLVANVKAALKAYAHRHSLEIEDNERCTHLKYAEITIDVSVGVRTQPDSEVLKIPIYDEYSKKYIYDLGKPETFINYFNDFAEKEVALELSELSLRNDSVLVDELEFQDGFLGSLRYASMLLKSHKDKFFSDDEESRKSVKGILISALCLRFYRPGLGVIEIIDSAIEYIEDALISFSTDIVVLDPTDSQENYASYLNVNLKKRELFSSWFNDLKSSWTKLKLASEDGFYDESLKFFFDADSVDYHINRLGKKITSNIGSGMLHVGIGGSLDTVATRSTIPMTTTKYWASTVIAESTLPCIGNFSRPLWEQVEEMKKQFPQFKVINTPSNCVEFIGFLKSPLTGRSRKVIIKYNKSWFFSRVYVEGVEANAPHIHLSLGNCLCLFKIDYKAWNHSMLISKTILPWTIQWIIQWELWKVSKRFNALEERH